MYILAFEFSSGQRSVALLRAQSPSGPIISAEAVETGQPGLHPFEMIEAVLRDGQVEREQIECLVVGLGPGSYSGIRAGIAVAQGWQLVRPVKLLGISTAECLAAQARADQLLGSVAVVIDAQRREFYLANYEVTAQNSRERRPLRLATSDEVGRSAAATMPVVAAD